MDDPLKAESPPASKALSPVAIGLIGLLASLALIALWAGGPHRKA
jgi:hypothetical protein